MNVIRVALALLIALTSFAAEPRPGWMGWGFILQRQGEEQWIAVRTITAEGPAAKAGLQVGDMVIAIDGKPIRFRDDLAFLEFLAKVRPHQNVVFTVARGEQRSRIRVTSADMTDARYERWLLNLEVAKKKRAESGN